MPPLVERLVTASERLSESWARVADDRDAALLARLVADAAPGHRRACLEVLLDANV